MELLQKYKGHREFDIGHVHHLPLTGIWNTVCYECNEGHDIVVGKGAWSSYTMKEGIESLRKHRNEEHGD